MGIRARHDVRDSYFHTALQMIAMQRQSDALSTNNKGGKPKIRQDK